MSSPFANEEVRTYVRDSESDISQLKTRVKELEAINLGLTKTLVEMEEENAELRAELFCNQMCVRYWPGHHSNCRFLATRLNRIKQQADDEGEA